MGRNIYSPLSYLGVEAKNPPNLWKINRAPTSSDHKKFDVGDFWLQPGTSNVWMLTNKYSGVATWTDISSDIVEQITITPGDLIITDGDFYLNNGGFVYGSITWPSTLRTLSDGTVYGLPDGDDGKILIGAAGLEPAWRNITSTGATVTITNGPNGINLEAAGGTAANTYTTDDAIGIVPTAGGNIFIAGGANITTNGATANTVTIALDASPSFTDLTLSGDLNVSNVIASGNIEASTGITSSNFTEGVVLSDGSGVLSSSNGIINYILTSTGPGSVPTWQANNDSSMDINTQAGNYTPILGDAGKEIQMTSATAATLTIPTQGTVAFEIGTQIIVVQYGVGTITVAGAGTVTINSVSSKVDTYEQYSAIALILQDTAGDGTWLLVGDLK